MFFERNRLFTIKFIITFRNESNNIKIHTYFENSGINAQMLHCNIPQLLCDILSQILKNQYHSISCYFIVFSIQALPIDRVLLFEHTIFILFILEKVYDAQLTGV